MRLIEALGCGLLACAWPLAGLAATGGSSSEPATEALLIGSAGTFALVEKFDYPYLIGLQYRGKPRTSWALAPGAGLSSGPDGLAYLYADVAHDFALPRRWGATLSLAAGYFANGDAIGANEHLEFQSGIAFWRRLESGTRIGLAGYHVSNGGLAHPNNGSESLVLSFAVPLRRPR